MNIGSLDQRFKNHLVSQFSLTDSQAEMLLLEINEYFNKTAEEYIQKKHYELQAMGKRNDEIYKIIQKELEVIRVKPPSFSLRQIRRIIYG